MSTPPAAPPRALLVAAYRLVACGAIAGFMLAGSTLSAQCPTVSIAFVGPHAVGGSLLTRCLSSTPDPVPGFRVSGTTAGAQVRYVLTDASFAVQATSTDGTFVDSLFGTDARHVFAVTYRGDWLLPEPGRGGMVGPNLYAQPLASTCAQLSRNFVTVVGERARAGTIAFRQTATPTTTPTASTVVCLDAGVAAVGFEALGAAGKQYAYLITDTLGRIRHVRSVGFHDFRGDGPGESRVYGLAYTGRLLARAGQPLASSPLASGCVEVSSTYLSVRHVLLAGSRIDVGGAERLRVDTEAGGRFVVNSRGGQSRVHRTYVVVDHGNFVLRLVSNTSNVDLNGLPAGTYLLYEYEHTGRFFGTTGEPLWSRSAAGPLAEGCFRNSDNAIVIEKSTAPLPPICLVQAGSLAPVRSPVEISSGIARVSALPTGVAVVPAGFESVYLLTRGTGDVIEAFRADAADFSVTVADTFRLFRFVGEFTDMHSADFFALSSLQLGRTTVDELRRSLEADGRCARLSLPATVVVLPGSGPCLAFAGGLTDPTSDPLPGNARYAIRARPDGQAVVPVGYTRLYVLTAGPGHEVIAVGTAPAFTVGPGDYRMHAAVAQVSDPRMANFVDTVPWRGQTVDALVDYVVARRVCADIAVGGVGFMLGGSGVCHADAGELRAVVDTIYTSGAVEARIAAEVRRAAIVPGAFELRYLLTDAGGRILAIATVPDVAVRATGTFTLHTWVAELSNPVAADFVNVATIRLGVTTLADLLELYAASGKCGAIESPGATIVVLPEPLAHGRPSPDSAPSMATPEIGAGAVAGQGAFSATPHFAVSATGASETMLVNASGQVVWRVRQVDGEQLAARRLRELGLPAGWYALVELVDGQTRTRQVILR